ncbi:hypothetical protein MSAN_01051800 [Mycena sanguinolenta]|uniref:Uncharacterized protein n=1 Tax=Mycena sanguinolenta TaxID=230812 RepID=A0A8H6YU58_9AGAR|nr:hypothetical protein MSAN_01051800 [Mycena sanguinolenta]
MKCAFQPLKSYTPSRRKSMTYAMTWFLKRTTMARFHRISLYQHKVFLLPPISIQVANAMTTPTQNAELPEISMGMTPTGLLRLYATMVPTESNRAHLSQFMSRWNTDNIMICGGNGSVSPAPIAPSCNDQLEVERDSIQSDQPLEDTDSVLLLQFDDDSSVLLVPVDPEELEKLASESEKLPIEEPRETRSSNL